MPLWPGDSAVGYTQPMTRRALFVVNRKARSGAGDLEPIRQRLIEGGLELIDHGDKAGDPTALIRRHGRDADLIVLGGGDGTVHRVLDALLEVNRPVGLLPLGTANDLARSLELPLDPLAACDVILHGRWQAIDVGRLNDRPFVNVASLGLAVDVTRRLTRGAKSRWGVLAYVWAAWWALSRGRAFEVEIIANGERLTTRTWQVTVGNGRSYGGGLTVHEDARIDDSLLDLYSLEVEQGWHILMLLPALWRGSLDPVPTVRTLHGQTFELRTPRRPRAITADGELCGETPAKFLIEPRALSVYVPQ